MEASLKVVFASISCMCLYFSVFNIIIAQKKSPPPQLIAQVALVKIRRELVIGCIESGIFLNTCYDTNVTPYHVELQVLRLFQRGKVDFNLIDACYKCIDTTTHFDFYVLRPPSQSVI